MDGPLNEKKLILVKNDQFKDYENTRTRISVEEYLLQEMENKQCNIE